MSGNSGNKSRKYILRNLIWAVISVLALIFVIQILLGVRTRHGQEILVPDFRGMTMDEASSLASGSGIRLDVTDSVYVSNLGYGCVFSQNPAAGEAVKEGRRILITINSTQPKTVAVPFLTGLSLRAARTEILSNALLVGRLSYVEDMATDCVLEQRYRGKAIRPGTRIEAGSRIDLVLGVNPEENSTLLPDLRGLSLEAASDMLFECSANLHKVRFDETVGSASDSLHAFVYFQSPSPQAGHVALGTDVDIYLTLDTLKFDLPASVPEN